MINQTKPLIERTLIELCRTNSFEKIRIHDVCAAAGISRQTFYNHFRDKYDVVASVFSRDVNAPELISGAYSYDLMLKGLKTLWNRREFYRDVLKCDGQNSLFSFAIQHAVESSVDIVREHYRKPLTADQKYQLVYCAYGCIGCIYEWLMGNLSYMPEELAKIQIESFPAFLTEAYD